MTLPLPRRVGELIAQVKNGYHPGLALDKHLEPKGEVKDQKPILQRICSNDASADENLLAFLNQRRRRALAEALAWIGTTRGPLTLHLSRATALENAGISLHPLYGFAYLPGSGLKGLARAWAERVWLEAQPEPDRERAVREIREVFGYAPHSEDGKPWIPPPIRKEEDNSAGAVVFHDAWPCRWPRLFVDVVTVHHREYYRAGEDKVPPPGDWEEPNPVCFLAVRPGTQFLFAVAPRPRRAEHAELAGKAGEWLAAALADWGAGAKTAAGYGRILAEKPPQPFASPQRRRFECTLELVTPAFLAGALQMQEDCDLRGATLRGQLRWWWRAMHAGHLEPRLLRRLETAIWGAAGEGSAVQLALSAVDDKLPAAFVVGRGDARGYLAYGMAEKNRFTKAADSKWTLAITARKAEFRQDLNSKEPAKCIVQDRALEQACAALWLLTHYGGVGAKGRKGFGSLADIVVEGVATVEDCRKLAARLRSELGLVSHGADRRAPSLEGMRPTEIPIRASDPDSAVRALANAYRDFVKACDKPDRLLLGLPRADRTVDIGIGQPVRRHPTSVHFHLAKTGAGLVLRMAAFEIDRLVRKRDFFQQMEEALGKVLGSGGSGGGPRPAARSPAVDAGTASAGQIREKGTALYRDEQVTVLDIRDADARVRYADGDVEWVKLADLRPIRDA